MTRYERVQTAIQGVEHQVSREGVRDLLLVVDLPDHREELGSVHVDAARSALDWFCKRHPNHPICVASSSRQNTKKSWEAFGYVHLSREYDWLRFVDLNSDPVPEMSFVIFLTTLHYHPIHGVRRPSEVWKTYHAKPEYHYTPTGHVWHREVSQGNLSYGSSHRRGVGNPAYRRGGEAKFTIASSPNLGEVPEGRRGIHHAEPNLVIVDASIARGHNGSFEPFPYPLQRIFAQVDLGEADRVCLDLVNP